MKTFSTTTKTIAWWLLGKLIKVVMDVSYCHRYYGTIIGEGGRPRYWSGKGGTWNTVKKLLNVPRTDEWRGWGSAPMLTNTVSTQDSVTTEWGHWSSSSSSPGHCHCQADHYQHWSIVSVSPGCVVLQCCYGGDKSLPQHTHQHTHIYCAWMVGSRHPP